ncbi:hypothetical protein [Flavobacterium rhizosphaerae]|uniref:Uncharacterized protein n=1 Tax=Flavobacterium rhizosphaerae TaxID=3163298 RepID=A0ABW8YYD1_9FLAO
MKKNTFLFGVALIVLFTVLADMYLWFSATAASPVFEHSQQAYLSHYPAQFQNARMLNYYFYCHACFQRIYLFQPL